MQEKNRLLIVDDDASNLMELVHILQPDYQLYTAKNGDAAIKRAKNTLPDIILLDVVMPEMNGFEVFEELKKFDETKDIPVIFVSGASEDDDKSTGLSIGAVDYIRKPFDPTDVKQRVCRHIDAINSKRTADTQL